MKYYIIAPSFDENQGGTIVLHKLCDLLNSLGEEAFLIPFCNHHLFYTKEGINCLYRIFNCIRFIRRYLLDYLFFNSFCVNSKWNTPVLGRLQCLFQLIDKNGILVCPEIISGRPYHIRNVVRYFLHNPGFLTGIINYGDNELYFRYSNSFAKNYVPNNSCAVSKTLLTIGTIPKCYNTDGVKDVRQGTAYLVRKGHNKKIKHDLTNSIKIDGLSHVQIAEVLKSVKCFYSYDAVTAYTQFAMLCECPIVIVLGIDESPETYMVNEESQQLFSYDSSRHTLEIIDTKKAREYAEKISVYKDQENVRLVKSFISETKSFFAKKDY